MSHTFTHRLNALLTFAVSVLAGMCALASLTDEFHVSSPVVDVQVLEIERFTRVDRNDEAYLVFSIDADLRSCFSWNTKQLFVSVQAEYEDFDETKGTTSTNVVSIWDRVVETKQSAVLKVPRARNKYKLKDRGHHLRGLDMNITMQWNKMPIAGKVRSEKRVFPGVTFPAEYIAADPNDARNGNRQRPQRGPDRNAMPHSAPGTKPQRSSDTHARGEF